MQKIYQIGQIMRTWGDEYIQKYQPHFTFYNQITFKKNWIVKVMPPVDNPQRVIDYLGRYVYRIAITDSRIKEVKIKERQVIFEYKDYAAQTDDNTPPPMKTMALDVLEFIRRFAHPITLYPYICYHHSLIRQLLIPITTYTFVCYDDLVVKFNLFKFTSKKQFAIIG